MVKRSELHTFALEEERVVYPQGGAGSSPGAEKAADVLDCDQPEATIPERANGSVFRRDFPAMLILKREVRPPIEAPKQIGGHAMTTEYQAKRDHGNTLHDPLRASHFLCEGWMDTLRLV